MASDQDDLSPECPVCLRYILPPVFQCHTGHLLCEDCLSRLQRCPLCQEVLPKKRIRNLEIEKLIKRRKFPCPFSEQGCQAMVSYDAIEDHKFDCSFGSFNICSIIGCSYDCNVEVAYPDFFDHLIRMCQASYPGDAFGMRHNQWITFSDIPKDDINRSVTYQGCIANEGRQVNWVFRAILAKEQIIWRCFVLRGKAFASRCILELDLLNGNEISRIAWRGPCLSLQRTEEELKASFITPVSVIKGMTANNGRLQFSWKLQFTEAEEEEWHDAAAKSSTGDNDAHGLREKLSCWPF